jgi:hypothetical protein
VSSANFTIDLTVCIFTIARISELVYVVVSTNGIDVFFCAYRAGVLAEDTLECQTRKK